MIKISSTHFGNLDLEQFVISDEHAGPLSLYLLDNEVFFVSMPMPDGEHAIYVKAEAARLVRDQLTTLSEADDESKTTVKLTVASRGGGTVTRANREGIEIQLPGHTHREPAAWVATIQGNTLREGRFLTTTQGRIALGQRQLP